MIVADTHAFIWWMNNPRQLSHDALTALVEADKIGIAAITCWEVALLHQRGRITIRGDVAQWLHSATATENVTVLPLSVEVAVRASRLPDVIRDPADRLIVATALEHGTSLVTKDGRITGSALVATIW
ncbi:MAG TPA: type II toxin-antitoxin system VapC family toxin [Thermoanaerobaculia bacterium]|nr:type II toxin-antitoxin system VapC family toxin [Thermoanaerobaculia bacterium]